MGDDLLKIKRWLKKQEVEDPIPTKSRDRVHDAMARSIRGTKPLPKGRCHICAGYTDRLVPVQMKICPICFGRFLKRGGPQRFQQREFARHYCDNCFGLTFVTILVNPLVCQRCSHRIGRFHRTESGELKRRRARDEKKLPFKGL